MKKEIEKRYERLRAGQRRPSFEYVSAETIRNVFAPYVSVEELEVFFNMSDDELKNFYDEWFNENVRPGLIRKELESPRLE